MSVLVQNLETGLYLAPKGAWVSLNGSPQTFANAVEAISFCIQRSLREIRLVYEAGCEGKERFFYPFGQDPAIQSEKKRLRRSLAESRRLKRQTNILLQRLEMMRAQTKEQNKQVPFERKQISADG